MYSSVLPIVGHGLRVSSDSLPSSVSTVRFLLECLWFVFSQAVYVVCQAAYFVKSV